MSYDDIIEVLAAALLEKAETVGCLEVLDGFSQRPDTEIEVSAPISEEMLALPLDKQEWPEECTPILKESSAATLGELVEYLNHCTATGKKLNISEDAATAMFPALITFCYDAADMNGNTYSVQRQGDGTYAVINSAAYATTDSMRHTLYYTQRNAGKFIIVETKAPTGYFGDWTDINHPGMANTPLGKRGYYIEITKDKDNSVIWLDNADYNADVAAADKGGTKLVTSTGVETTVTIYDTSKDPRRTYNTDNSGKAANEDSYTITPTDGVMKNDRTLGEISISKVDLDAVRYVGGSTAHGTALASGQAHGDAALDGAVYDLYAAEDITHPDGVTGVVDYSKIVDTDGNPIWHTTIRDNSGQWVSDYLPVLKKDHLVASAKIENGWLCFSNLYLGKYYVVERSTGVVIPLRDGALAVSGTYPTVDSRIKAATGQTAAFAKNGSGQYTDWVYKNKFSTVSKGKALDGSWTYDAYYLSFAGGYLCDEHNYYITPAYSDEGWYVEKTTFADNRQAAGEQIDKTSYSANYHIHADNALAESQDQVAKGNVEISKIVSSSGQSNGLELEGAGFTFFLVSDLSKAEQFEQTRSGSYTLQSILDDVTFAWDNELNDVVMATSIAKVDGAASSQSFEVVRSKDIRRHCPRTRCSTSASPQMNPSDWHD